MSKKHYSISFCIVCMNRLHQLKQTFLKNIEDNESYANLEFVVLDYNSGDSLEHWMKENLSNHILSGRVVYYKTFEPKKFNHSHSKNVAFQLAKSDIVCNISADNFTGRNFSVYINDCFNDDENIVLTPIDLFKTKKNYHPAKDVFGRVCVKKSDFKAVGGFNQQIVEYGFEDFDFINRLELLGIRRTLIEDFSYLKFVPHQDDERYMISTANLTDIYIKYCSPATSEIILFYKDQSYEKGIVVDNHINDANNHQRSYEPADALFEFSWKQPGLETGTWIDTIEAIVITSLTKQCMTLYRFHKQGNNFLMDLSTSEVYQCITNYDIISNVLDFNYIIKSRAIMEDAMSKKTIIVNSNSFGKATVYKNFDYQNPIII